MTDLKTKLLSVNLCVICLLSAASFAQQPSPMDMLEYRAPQPPPVGTRKIDVGIEIHAPLGQATFVKAQDGRIMMINSNKIMYTADKGKTWSDPNIMPQKVNQVIRLNSGKLGGLHGDDFYTSSDEGKSWQKQGSYTTSVKGWPYTNTLIQTRSGRLLLPVRWTEGSGHHGTYGTDRGVGMLNGKLVAIEGHAHYPEPDNGFVVYSDDEGKTWNRSQGGIMVWHKDGYGGMWPCDEPSLIEASNGDVVLLFRTTLGRVYQSLSQQVKFLDSKGKIIHRQPGDLFDYPQPTELAGSYSPCAVARIPETGHWLIIWNQVSGDQIRGGYRRGRLSSAISEDDGKTWKHFRTIDTSVLPPAGKVQPDPTPQMARGLDYVGVLPEDYGSVGYPTVDVIDDTVFLTWQKNVVKTRPNDVRGLLMRVMPLSWFYQDEPQPTKPQPKLFLKVAVNEAAGLYNTFEIPADYYDGRFYCNLNDLAVFLRSPVGRLGYNMYAPLNQVITCLGYIPTYDRTNLEDPDNPRMTVTCKHPHAYEAPKEIYLKPTPGANNIEPSGGIPVWLFDVPVGTKKKLIFEIDIDLEKIIKASLKLVTDDIDAPNEAVITLNGKTNIEVDKSIIGEGENHLGSLNIPPAALQKGTNAFEFIFADNLADSTAGYIITEALLVLETE